jgi:ATP-dependent RNA helicase RhlE
MPFASLGLRQELASAVLEAGYTQPTPIQSQAIPAILAGRDVIGVAQTGTGKTAAFMLPILERLADTRSHSRRTAGALIIAPTRELALQIEEAARPWTERLRLRSVTIYGGVAERPQIDALHRGIDVIIATPGRLLDLTSQGHVHFSHLQTLVLDEADRMLDMGFLPSIRRIIRQLPVDRQTLLFSATLSREIEQIASDFLRDPQVVEIGRRSSPADSVGHTVHEVPADQKADLLVHILRDREMSSVLVFTRTKHGADKVARKLHAAGFLSATIHSNRTQAQRLRALQRFRDGEVRVLVATDIAARGIDVEAISHVVNYDFPEQTDDYVHRIGRTGRAELEGEAISFVTPLDYPNLRRVESAIGKRIARIDADGFVVRRVTVAPVVPVRPSTVIPRSFGPRRRTRP